MRSLIGGSQASAAARKLLRSRLVTCTNHNRLHQRCCRLNVTHLHAANVQLQRTICASSTILSTPDSFHGVPLPENNDAKINKIQEAEVVDTEEGRRKTRELIKEVTRAEMMAHSIIADNTKSSEDAVKEPKSNALGPYERRLQQLKEAESRHEAFYDESPIAYAQSSMNLGELHYELGHMEDSQELYMTALKQLLEFSGNTDSQDDDEVVEEKMLVAQCMHYLGAIHARCGEFEEASRWYKESLKKKSEMLLLLNNNETADDSSSNAATTASISIHCRYELGKTYNGLAALEVMKGGDVQWDRAMSLFKQAEKNYLHGYVEGNISDCQSQPHNPLAATRKPPLVNVTKEALQRMPPRHAESLINVRVNMGELLVQRERYESAADIFQLALDMAQMALENTYEKNQASSKESDLSLSADSIVGGPSPDEQRNTIVELTVKIADALVAAKKYDMAAESYEQALDSHIHFRDWTSEDDITKTDNAEQSFKQKTVLPVVSLSNDPNIVKYDLNKATKMEAAIRTSLAHALAQIGQHDLSLKQFEASLKIKRHIGGDFHMEVAHTLMGLGALAGGPLRDFTKALNCFKEALFIYRANFEEYTRGSDDGNNGTSQMFFARDEELDEIDEHIQNATKNISMIEAALLKDDKGKRRRRKGGGKGSNNMPNDMPGQARA